MRTTAQVRQGFRAGLGIHAVCVLPAILQSPSRDPCKRVWDVRVTLFIPEGQGVCVGGSPACKDVVLVRKDQSHGASGRQLGGRWHHSAGDLHVSL